MEIVLVGLNFRTAPVEVREKVSFSHEQALRASEELRSSGILEETLVLSTCNRSEVYGVHASATRESAAALSSYLSKFHELKPDLLNPSLYHHYDHDVVRHLFRVSAGLESMLLGEAEILGQVREAYLRAHDGHVTGPVLNRLFQAALEVGKRVRAETELGTRPMGVASAGMKLAERIFGKLNDRSALVLGAGTISEQVVSQLRDRNIGHLYVTNRSREKAEEFAKEYKGNVVEWGEWDTALKLPDVIVSAVGVQEPLLTKALIERAMAARGNRALFLMDLGLPRNIAPAVSELYNTYLYTMDDLTEIVRTEPERAAKRGAEGGSAGRRARGEIHFVASERGIDWSAGYLARSAEDQARGVFAGEVEWNGTVHRGGSRALGAADGRTDRKTVDRAGGTVARGKGVSQEDSEPGSDPGIVLIG